MGNRAIVAGIDNKEQVYLHWNGGRDSVQAFLRYCELKGYGGFDDSYGKARFCQVVGNFFGGGLSLGVVSNQTGCDDNGVFIVKGWEIVGRKDFAGCEQDEYELKRMLLAINKAQPRAEQLPQAVLTGTEIEPSKLKVGQYVWVMDGESTYTKYEVMGIGCKGWCNGIDTDGVPYVNRYANDGRYDLNPNNFITKPVYRASRPRKK